MTDVVEVQAVQCGIPLHQLGKGRRQAIRDSGRARIEPEGRGAHPVVATVRLRDLEAGIVEDGAPLLIDGGDAGPEIPEDRRIRVRGQRENVHPGVDP